MYISELYDKLKNGEVVLYGNVDEIKENIDLLKIDSAEG